MFNYILHNFSENMITHFQLAGLDSTVCGKDMQKSILIKT